MKRRSRELLKGAWICDVLRESRRFVESCAGGVEVVEREAFQRPVRFNQHGNGRA